MGSAFRSCSYGTGFPNSVFLNRISLRAVCMGTV